MKFFTKLVLIALIGFIGQLFLPFWIVAIAGILVSLMIKTNGLSSFFSGFIGVFILWLVSAFFINQGTDGILSEKMISIIPVGSVTVLIIVTAFIGGLVGGFGALTGSMLSATFSKQSRY